MEKKTPITEAFLKKYGFKLDSTAPQGVVRYNRKFRDMAESFFATVLLVNGKAIDVRICKTVFSLICPGAVAAVDKRCFGTELNPGTVEELLAAQEELNLEIIKNYSTTI